eukprot:611115-Amphidinium_carterae.2
MTSPVASAMAVPLVAVAPPVMVTPAAVSHCSTPSDHAAPTMTDMAATSDSALATAVTATAPMTAILYQLPNLNKHH